MLRYYWVICKLSCYLDQPHSTFLQIHPSCSNDFFAAGQASRDGEIELKIELVQPRDDSEWAGAGHALDHVHVSTKRGVRRA